MSYPKNDYGMLVNETEMDSDVNEDRHREKQLDDSLEAWYENVEQQVKQKLELTNVPQSNVFDSKKEGTYDE